MRYIKQKITDYESPNVTQEYATFDSLTAYSQSQIIQFGNINYNSAIDNNLGNIPTQENSKYWIDWGTSNKFALLDLQSQTKTVLADDLVMTFDLGDIDTIATGFYTATSLIVENIDDNGLVLFSQNFTQTTNEDVFDYFDYIYSDYTIATDISKYIEIPRVGTKVRVTFTKGILSDVQIGFLVGGKAIEMGQTLDNVSLGAIRYSIEEFDQYGRLKTTKRKNQNIMDFETLVTSESSMPKRRQALRDTSIIVAIVIDDNINSKFENMVTLGIIKQCDLLATSLDKTVLSWSVTEVI